jgi:CheY-like chemotaxis protein
MRALVIDDDDVARELLVSVLQDGGHETIDLPSPIGATRAIIEKRVDVVVLDLLMPLISGEKLVRMLRANPRLRGLRIVLVSSCDPEQLRGLAKNVGADAVVEKKDIRKLLLATLGPAPSALRS